MAQGSKLPDMERSNDLDEIDIQIVALLKSNPDITFREIAGQVGVPKSTAWERIRRIRGSKWVDAMRRDLKRIHVKYIEAIEDGVDYPTPAKDRAAVAERLLRGLGVLDDSKTVHVKLEDATPEQIAEAIRKLPDDKLAELIAAREAVDGSGDAEG